ncbi:MAG: Uma2 family endonuclease [Cyanobacteria bacterium CAN_BIN43]|nr:Uma2 family endonuclease [Cyanobacteria bacterium CAN_BIN43]
MTLSISRTDSPVAIPPLCQWHNATWEDYELLRDAPIRERMKLAFDRGRLWVDMGGEGINHSGYSDLVTSLLFFWAVQHPDEAYSSLGRCLLEKPKTQACAPDLVLYVGADYPEWQEGEPRRVDLTKWRVPNLVGEISDTSLASDLDEQKHLYAALGVPEYWVVDVRGRQIFAFLLDENGQYQSGTHSLALKGLARSKADPFGIALVEQTLQKLNEGTNTSAAAWFAQEITKL